MAAFFILYIASSRQINFSPHSSAYISVISTHIPIRITR